jgi:hypothetical protein
MKSIVVLIIMLFISFSIYGQEVKTPKHVKNAFEKLYPNASEVNWEKEKHNEFEAGFKNDGKSISVVFDKSGNLLATKNSILISDLPKRIPRSIEKKHIGFTITKASKIIDDKGDITFEAEISKGQEIKKMVFDQDGRHITKKKMNKGKNEKNITTK